MLVYGRDYDAIVVLMYLTVMAGTEEYDVLTIEARVCTDEGLVLLLLTAAISERHYPHPLM